MKEQIQQRVKSKTYRLAIAVMILGYLQQNFSLIDSYLGEYKNSVYFAIGLAIMILRELTKEPLSEKGKPP